METTVYQATTSQTAYPLLSDRIQSTFIDSIFMIALMYLFSSQLEKYENAPDWIRIALFIGLWGIYEPLCTTLGCTLGNYIKGIRVRQSHNPYKRINIVQAFIRYFLKLTLGWISFLAIHSNKERRALHDLAAYSVMIKVKTTGSNDGV
jgi:cytochrome bd-type quinol oxidase subunit 2